MSDFNKNPFSASQVVTSIRTEGQIDLNRRSGGIRTNLKAHQLQYIAAIIQIRQENGTYGHNLTQTQVK